MKNRVTHFKALLFLLALVFGVQSFAQDIPPVKNTGSNQTLDVNMSPSNLKPASWNLENEVYQATKNFDANASYLPENAAVKKVQPTPAQNAAYAAEKEQKHAAEQAAHAAKMALIQEGPNGAYHAQKLAEINAPKVTRDVSTQNDVPYTYAPSDAIWDVLLNFQVNHDPDFLSETGVETDGFYIYTGYFNQAGKFSKYTLNGVWIEDFIVPSGPLTRDMAYNPQDGLFYIADGTNKIKIVNMASQNLSGFITCAGPGVNRHLTFDPNLDNGVGGFWTGDWYNLKAVKMDGSLIANFPSFATFFSSPHGVYGSAWDGNTPGGPYIWFFAQGGAVSGVELVRYNIAANTYSVQHNATDLPFFAVGDMAGGLAATPSLIPGKLVLLGLTQGALIDHVFEYDLAYTPLYPNDLGVFNINTPNSGLGLTANEPVNVTIANYGNAPQSNFPVYFTVNGGNPVSATYTGTIQPGGTALFTIGNYDFSAQNYYTIVACTQLANDQQVANDCVTKVISNNILGHDTIWPGNAPYWTGTTDGTSFIENNKIRSYPMGRQGWAKFDVSSIPSTAIITAASVHYNVYASNIPYFRLTKVNNDPMTGTPTSVRNDIINGFVYGTYTSQYSIGWHHISINNAIGDISASLANGWFALGFYEYESGGSYNLDIDGWQDPTRPYLVLDYLIPLANDCGITAITSPTSGVNLPANATITVNIKNFGTVPQTNIPVSVTINGGTPVTGTYTGTAIMPGATQAFPVGTANFSAYGYYNMTACTQLASDQQPNNNCYSTTITNLFTGTDTIWPGNGPYWTGTTDGSAFTESSLIKSVSSNAYQGYAKFDLSNLPGTATITGASVHYNVYESFIPYFRLTKVAIDPMANSASAVKSAITGGTSYGTYTSEYSVGWHHITINNAAADITAAVANGWFALGFYEYEGGGSYTLHINGWNETNKPYMIVNYNYIPTNNDVGISTLLTPSSSGFLGNEDVIVRVKNYGLGTVSTPFNITYSINGGATQTIPYSGTLAPNATDDVLLTNYDFSSYGNYAIHACTNLPNDDYAGNNCKDFGVNHFLPIVTDTFYPGNGPLWTGTTDGTTFTDVNKIKSIAGGYQGYAKFDLSGFPATAPILAASLHYNVYESYIPYFNLTRVNVDPLTSGADVVRNAIATGTVYAQYSSEYSVGWHHLNVAPAIADIAAGAQNNNAFTFGWHEYESATWYLHIDGWQDANRPYLVLQYQQVLAHDVGVQSIAIDPFVLAGNVPITCVVANFGTNTETFSVTATAPGGYTSTVNNITLAPSTTQTITFPDLWNAPAGQNQTVTVCTSLGSDVNGFNNCMSKTTLVEAHLTQAYAFNAYDPSGNLPIGPVRFFLEHPETVISIASQTAPDFIAAGTWANNEWFVQEYYDPANFYNHGHLYKVDPITGVMTSLGAPGLGINGMAYEPYTNTLYAIATTVNSSGVPVNSSLYSLDMTTGAPTLVQDLGNSLGLPVNLAISPGGLLYTVDLNTERFYTIDPVTGTTTFIETMPWNFNYAQDCEFDFNTGRLWMTSYTTTAKLLKYTPQSLTLNNLGTFAGGAEITGFALPYTFNTVAHDIAVKWIMYPVSGNLTNGEPVIAGIRNLGTEPETDFGVHFEARNYYGQIIQEEHTTWNTLTFGYTLAPGEEFPLAFWQVLDMSTPGIYKVAVWVEGLPGDARYQNDTLGKKAYNVSCNINCFANAIAEQEACGFETNDGCNMAVPAYEDIENGQAVCGNLWKQDNTRDTDWYRFTLTGPQSVTIKARGEYPLNIMIVSLPCATGPAIASKLVDFCTLDSMYVNFLGAGEYAIVVAADWAAYNMTCNTNTQYTFSFLLGTPKYCATATTTVGCLRWINGVQFGSINNQNTGCSPNPLGYADYTQYFTNMSLGDTATCHVRAGAWVSWLNVGAWVDWNHDYDFDDADEKFIFPQVTSDVNYKSLITVPVHALPGNTRMRVRLISSSGTLVPCGSNLWGEVEDYRINVIVPIPPVKVYAPEISDVCPGQKVIPITVDNFNDVNGFNLVLGITSGVSYVNVQNVHPSIAANLQVFGNPTNITANWFGSVAASIPNGGTLFELVVNATSGTHALIWDEGVEGCQISNFTNGILPDIYDGGSMTFGNCSNVEGTITYANTPHTPMNNTIVNMVQNGTVVAQTTTNAAGFYQFLDMDLGTYTMTFSTQKTFGGINASDALGILRHFVQIPPLLSGIYFICADVNGSAGIPNSTDALTVSRRFVNQIPAYTPPYTPAPGGKDWYFAASDVVIVNSIIPATTVVVTGTANQTKNILAVCGGDVNGSYVPSALPIKETPSVFVKTEGSVLMNGTVQIPVRIESANSIGAISLVMNYPSRLEITNVSISKNAANLVYTAKDGQLRLAWFSTDALNLNNGDVMLTITAKLNSLNKEDIYFTATEESVIADENNVSLENVNLLMPKLVSTVSEDDYSISNYPNPFSTSTLISYSIPVKGFVSVNVYNVLGELVSTLVNAEQNAGSYNVNYDALNLQRGVYYYKLEVNGVTKTRSMVIGE